MPRKTHADIARGGAAAILEWRKKNANAKLELADAVLAGVNLTGADLTLADLRGTNLKGARLYQTNLYRVNAAGADLQGADLRLAQIRGTNLENANLKGVRLIGATLRTVELSGANLDRAIFGGTIISSTDLSGAHGLDTTRHDRPSSLGMDTIVKSRGRIPPDFLRSVGIPEALVKFVLTLARDSLGFYSCFLSYTEKDTELTEKLYRDLEKRGVRCWRWREDAKWGDPLQKSIDEALEEHEKVIVILSADSIAAKPVLYEIEKTIEREKSSRKAVLFPVRIDDAIFGWNHEARDEILKKHIGDFTAWRTPKGYRAALDRLLDDLRAEKK